MPHEIYEIDGARSAISGDVDSKTEEKNAEFITDRNMIRVYVEVRLRIDQPKAELFHLKNICVPSSLKNKIQKLGVL